MKKRKIVEPSKVPWSIEYMGKQGTVIHDADGRLALVCPVHNAELIVNAVKVMCGMYPNAELRIVRRPADWEVAK